MPSVLKNKDIYDLTTGHRASHLVVDWVELSFVCSIACLNSALPAGNFAWRDCWTLKSTKPLSTNWWSTLYRTQTPTSMIFPSMIVIRTETNPILIAECLCQGPVSSESSRANSFSFFHFLHPTPSLLAVRIKLQKVWAPRPCILHLDGQSCR